ncbi:ATP-dependent zinc metalloprotease FtsH [Ktedonobacter sp. SOSP1-85]|uniref:ATP-dependent zinc metalloprotease FtsH n=1 Tax=Ktedonobacter sp. SOSP1-85 TaxID=2778367 RepID=UPI0019168990|nr:ATP-dependent zinc metalloprotease FtsH [Ktedonobacter sp. SOSP1-85]GHO74490.1 ATP-dependent zinc metalloprotease FtsH [Ktedonobacter sp. SOSP1-85]
MDRQPGNRYWLQNNNDRQQIRPGGPPNNNGQNQQPRPSNRLNSVLLALVVVMLGLALFNFFNNASQNTANSSQSNELSYTQFYQQIQQKNVKSATIVGQSDITGTLREPFKGKQNFHVYQLPNGDDKLAQNLIQSGATVTYQPPPDNSFWLNLLIASIPWIFLIGFIFFLTRRASQGQQGIFSFGKSRAKLILEDRPSTTFADVAGVDESKYELQEVVEFLKTPQKFQRLGGKIPRGVLLVGPPGTGKTLLARAVAGEAGVPFFSMSGSEFVEVLVGVGASRVRDLFDQAKKASPSIIFIDEIDAVGRQRGSSINTNDEREQTLNQLLVEMDGFDNRQAVVVVAATNRPDGLDQALLRPGRFDRRVTVDRPDWNGRLAILKIHTRTVPLAPDINLTTIARGTTGMVGADLANLVNEAAIIAARRNLDYVTQPSFDEALDKILLGAERPLVLSDADLDVTAYHEGGHALAGLVTEECDPVTKVTIVPRGQALGVTMSTPLDDRYNYSREYLLAQLVYALGGRAAEQVIFDRITTGAENDLQRVTQIARQMVARWGMSERLGTVSFSERQSPFMGGDMGNPTDYSEETAQIIDEEVSRIINECYERTLNVMRTYRPTLDRIAKDLRTHETIDAKQLHTIMESTGAPIASTQLHPTPQQVQVVEAPPPPASLLQPPEMQ